MTPFANSLALRAGSRTLSALPDCGRGHVLQGEPGQADPVEGPRIDHPVAAHETAPFHTCPTCNHVEICIYDEPANHAHFCSRCRSEFTIIKGKGILL